MVKKKEKKVDNFENFVKIIFVGAVAIIVLGSLVDVYAGFKGDQLKQLRISHCESEGLTYLGSDVTHFECGKVDDNGRILEVRWYAYEYNNEVEE